MRRLRVAVLPATFLLMATGCGGGHSAADTRVCEDYQHLIDANAAHEGPDVHKQLVFVALDDATKAADRRLGTAAYNDLANQTPNKPVTPDFTYVYDKCSTILGHPFQVAPETTTIPSDGETSGTVCYPDATAYCGLSTP
jgi:hypothetical protein